MTKETIQNEGLDKIKADFQLMMSSFKQMLESLGETELSNLLPWLNGGQVVDPPYQVSDQKLAQAIGMSFELLNLVEENAATQFRRKLETLFGLEAIRGSWGETLHLWKTAGIDQQQIAEMLPNINVMPVLTAHPTEAKRVTVLSIHRELYMLLVKNENPIWSTSEKKIIQEEITALLERWWRTGEIYLQKPTLENERKNLMHYFVNVFPEALRLTDQRLRNAWNAMEFDPKLLQSPEQFPILQFGSWVGGDRDGHPYVTPEFTASTLLEHRRAALQMIKKALLELASKLSFSEQTNPPSQELINILQEKALQLGANGQSALDRNLLEPWRQYVNLMLVRLENTIVEDQSNDVTQYYARAKDLSDDLKYLRQTLMEIKAHRIASEQLFPVERMVQCFGFHLAKLDIRQNSAYHEKVVSQMLKTA